MKQTLQLKMGQQLTMTPQLQQAIRLLQLSALDLQAEIQEAMESNPLLEMAEEDTYGSVDADHHEEVQARMDERVSALADNQGDADVSTQLENKLQEDLPVDTQWEEVYPTQPSLAAPADSDYDPLANRTTAQTLNEHLTWQLEMSSMAPADRLIATAIIDAIAPNGLLESSTEELLEGLLSNPQIRQAVPDLCEYLDHAYLLQILEQVQDFDPVGIGARDLSECLLLQIQQLPHNTPSMDEAILLITEHLDLLGSKDFTTLKRRTRLSEAELAAAVKLIQCLNPQPGYSIEEVESDYIVPDVIVTKKEGRWVVELNNDVTPQVRISTLYEDLAQHSKDSSARAYMRDNLQEARWFLKSLQTRHDTLLRVASRIVEVQRGFFEYGPEAMKPLILADVAEAVDLHESTISRVTNRKYMSTPRGVFELKYFFSSHVGTSTGGEVSSTAIRAVIQKLTAEEDPKKPLSDNKIAAILKAQNINVARRTVAKYRESMSIPPSNERKQLV
ncbi:MAG: RNA polymerase factor sigma-54 [Pseudomonadota bacterium]